jgi:hypothetical protein
MKSALLFFKVVIGDNNLGRIEYIDDGWNTLTWISIQRYTNYTDWVRSLDQIDNDQYLQVS